MVFVTRFNLVLVWSKTVQILTKKPFKWVRHNQVSWSSFIMASVHMCTKIFYISDRKYDDCFCHVAPVPVPDDVLPPPLCGWRQCQGQASWVRPNSLHSAGHVVGIYTHTDNQIALIHILIWLFKVWYKSEWLAFCFYLGGAVTDRQQLIGSTGPDVVELKQTKTYT